jgi:DNA-binding LytR/AlgR family response regulator
VIRVLIVEDEAPAAEKLRAALAATGALVSVVGVCDSVRSGTEWFEYNPHPDLILADIQLTDGTSFHLFEQVRPRCPVVYVTAYDAHLLDAFAAGGIDYLLKPIRPEHLEAALAKYRSLQAHFQGQTAQTSKVGGPRGPTIDTAGHRQRLVVRKGLDEMSLPVEQAAWLTSEHKLSFVVDRQGQRYLVDATLAELEASLDPARFFRLNRQYLANIDGIDRFRSAGRGRLCVRLVPEASEEVVVSQERAGAFRRWIAG